MSSRTRKCSHDLSLGTQIRERKTKNFCYFCLPKAAASVEKTDGRMSIFSILAFTYKLTFNDQSFVQGYLLSRIGNIFEAC